jgi:hypothetical protein
MLMRKRWMRLLWIFGICASVVILCLGIVGYLKFLWPERLEHEAIAGERRFHAHPDSYRKLIDSWNSIEPQKCGKPTSPGFVSVKSVNKSRDGSFGFGEDNSIDSGLSLSELAGHFDGKQEAVLSLVEGLDLSKSQAIIQTGAEVKIVMAENDTRGYLHIDPSCPGAATIAFWSKQSGNFTVVNPGSYVGLKSLGDGWYYYIEQR